MQIGKITVDSLNGWTVAPGRMVSWHPTPESAAAATRAPISPVPISYMQQQHLRNYADRTAAGLSFSRQIIASCEVPGTCDRAAMNLALNNYLRRHDTFRSWFERGEDDEFVRHTIGDPADIVFEPVDHGEMSVEEIREHVVSIPGSLEWGCFTFGIIERDDHFTFFTAVDHVHGDATLIGSTMLEANGAYTSFSTTGTPLVLPDAGSFDEFCRSEREYTAALTTDSPGVRAWIEFAENNDNGLPEFPLPLGNPTTTNRSTIVSELLIDRERTERLEEVCTGAGVRFIGGLLACLALVDHELTGAATYYGLTPRDTRSTSDNFMTQGWFTGMIPITVPIAGASFTDAAWAAQTSFDAGLDYAKVPYYRVLELAPHLNWPRVNFAVSNFFHADAAPFNTIIAAADMGYAKNIGIYSDGRYSYQLTIYIFRYDQGTVMAVMHPDNPVAQKSIARYLAAMKSVLTQVADHGGWGRVA